MQADTESLARSVVQHTFALKSLSEAVGCNTSGIQLLLNLIKVQHKDLEDLRILVSELQRGIMR